ncbi:hypothetical protein [Desulfosporosinus sp. SB140]
MPDISGLWLIIYKAARLRTGGKLMSQPFQGSTGPLVADKLDFVIS